MKKLTFFLAFLALATAYAQDPLALADLDIRHGSERLTLSPECEALLKSDDETTCTQSVSYEVSRVDIIGFSNEGSIVSGNKSDVFLAVGNNEFEIIVSHGEESETYTIIIQRGPKNDDPPSADATLSSITLSAGVLSPAFNSEETEYTVSVPYSVENIDVIGALSYQYANLVYLDGSVNIALEEGVEKIVRLSVQAEAGNEKNYTLRITRAKGNEETLSSIEVYLGSSTTNVLSGFNADKLDYEISVPNSVENATVTAIKAPMASFVGAGSENRNLAEGTNVFSFVVKPEKGEQKTFTIAINRLAASANANLGSISVFSGVATFNLNPAFDQTITSYSVSVPYATEEITINATRADPLAEIIFGTGSHPLIVGQKSITIGVLAENGTTNTYVINVTREKASVDPIEVNYLGSTTYLANFSTTASFNTHNGLCDATPSIKYGLACDTETPPKDAGTHKVCVTIPPTDDCAGSTANFDLVIAPRSLNSPGIEVNAGSSKVQQYEFLLIDVKDGDIPLVEGVDYVEGEQNTDNIGSLSVLLTGTNNYTGVRMLPLSVVQKTPVISIDYEKEILTGFINGEHYRIDGGEAFQQIGLSRGIDPSWFSGKTIYISRADNSALSAELDAFASDPFEIKIPARPAAPSNFVVQAKHELMLDRNDGALLGTNSSMECKKDSDAEYSECAEFEEDLAPGFYQIRFKATDKDFAGLPLTVEINSGADPEEKIYVYVNDFNATFGYESVGTSDIFIVNSLPATIIISDIVSNNDAFAITPSDNKEIASNGTNRSWKITPSLGLPAGEHTAKLTLTFEGEDYEIESEVKFAVGKKSLTRDMFDVSNPIYYDGEEQKPVTSDLTKDTDYTITYSANTNAGEATAEIEGIGNYAGNVNINFTILPKTINIIPTTTTKIYGEEDPVLDYDM
ncbi:MAG: cadherin-like beta sandwich domain-containing protein, partial [Fibromonadales bacterium]|nr:cadherin-like beta sandwich domain-containing protein [Fibromonadales bacterium]